jgi:hypothetical protein
MTSATLPVILPLTSSIVAGKVGKWKLPIPAYCSCILNLSDLDHTVTYGNCPVDI